MRVSLTMLALMAWSQYAYAKDSHENLRFVLLTPFVDYSFFDAVKKGMNDAAAATGVHAEFAGTKGGDMTALAQKVREAVNHGCDGIALNITDPVALDDVVAEALRNGVPVISFNVDDSRTPNARLSSVGQNMHSAGHKFARALETTIANGSHILMTMHDPNISALEDRARGIKEVLSSRGAVITQLITTTDREQAVARIHAALKADPRIKVIVGTGSADTEAAGQVIEEFFSGENYIAAGFDVNASILRMIKAGSLRFTIDQQPYTQGYLAVTVLSLYKRYGLMPASIDTGATLITTENADQVVDLSRKHIR